MAACFIVGTGFMSVSTCPDSGTHTLAVIIFVAQALATGLLLTIMYMINPALYNIVKTDTEEEVRTKPIELGYQLKSFPCMHTLLERILDHKFTMWPSAAHAAAFVGAEMFLPDGVDGLCGSLRRQSKPEDWLQFQMHVE
ncbi:hypothetical protein Pelo_18642 [Pelomyxa schiedti]|nr:hypothetical protein Pelo_18642 [Pelomyxa schiedti]